jgi:hypothetical protein
MLKEQLAGFFASLKYDKPNASSSIGRVAVSKTVGWGFESLLACF